MPEGEILHVLLSHDRWATGQLLDACAKLSEEQFHRRFEIGAESLHDTLTHAVAAMRAWTDTLSGAEPRPRIDSDGQRRSPDDLRALHEEASSHFAAEARRRPHDELVTRRTRDGRTLQMTRGAVIAQVVTHDMHHRAQCLNMLRQLGVKPLPPSSVAEWTWLGQTQA